MSTVIKITPDQLSAALAKENARVKKNVHLASRAAAMKLKTYLVAKTDEMGITDLGIYKSSFNVVENTVSNDAPHAGIVELGARPHPVSKEGQEAIKRWAMRKLGLEEKEAERATFLICRKIRKHGQKGRYVMRDSLDKALEFFKEEFARIMKSGLGKPA